MAELDLESLTDLRTPWCVHVVATLRIAEHMRDGTHRVDELAAAAGADAGALQAVLAHLAAKGVFVETERGSYALGPGAEVLIEQQPFLSLDGIGGRFAEAWATLLAYVRSGEPA